MRDFLEILGVVFVMLVVVVGFILGLFVVAHVIIDPRVCDARWGDRGHWGFWSGCMVETNRGLLPAVSLTPADIGVEITQ